MSAIATNESLNAFEDGLRLFAERQVEQAHEQFRKAHRKLVNDPRAMSWYGVTLVLVERNSNLAISYVDQAVRLAGPTPELILNQARVHLALNQRERAYKAVQRGMSLFADDVGLRWAQEAMGWRRRPVIPFLSRRNFLNKHLGKLRHKWRKHRSPPPEMNPVTLGQPPHEGAELPRS
jgi:tetratricopeptide (TPR) repeat protein